VSFASAILGDPRAYVILIPDRWGCLVLVGIKRVNYSSQNLVAQVFQAADHVLNNDIALAEESLQKGETSFHMVRDI
jgi:hypothetical protein